jgi:hypothetical protein
MNLEEEPSPDLETIAKIINDQETLKKNFLSVQAIDPGSSSSRNLFRFSDSTSITQLPPVKLTEIGQTEDGSQLPGLIGVPTSINLSNGTVRVAVSRGNGTVSSGTGTGTRGNGTDAPAENNGAANVALLRAQKSLEVVKSGVPTSWLDTAVIVVCALLGLLVAICAGGFRFDRLIFDPKLGQNLANVLGALLVVSTFVERVIEVFVSAWSDPESDQHEQNRDYWKSRQAELKNAVSDLLSELNGTNPPSPARQAEIAKLLSDKRAAIEDAGKLADVESKALLPFEARTRRISTWIGLVVGMLVSAVGFRFLGQIVSPDTDKLQYPFFIAADVLLTGAVLAGGSKLIHEIFSLYESFMDLTQDKLASKGASGK